MDKFVDSYRFLDGITRRLASTWAKLETPREIPWTVLTKPLPECNVALISSGGLAMKGDEPFDQEGERQNPWWGDPSFRILPNTATEADVEVYHLHVDPRFVKADLNCLLPLQRLQELEASGEIGRSATSHYSFMGYIMQPEELLERTAPAIVRSLQQEEVDVVLLVPA